MVNDIESNTDRLQIDDLTLDKGTRQVWRGKQRLDLPKLSYRMLLALVEAAPNVVTFDQLAEIVWPDSVVSPETITQRIKLVRQSLDDDANSPRYIGAVRGEGYRLLTEVETLPPEDANLTRGLVAELGRRRVLQVALVYAAVAWSITEVVSFLIEALPVFPAWSKALVAIVFVVGFPVAMFLAWRFDIGPSGIRRTTTTSGDGRLTIVAAVLLLVGATAGLFYLIYPSVVEQAGGQAVSVAREPAPENSVAVLPFANTSANEDDLYVSEGLGDVLREQLASIAELRVAARSSSTLFREEAIDAVAVAERLGVRKLVEGTMRKQDDRLRVTVQVIDGNSGFQDWTEVYEFAQDDLATIQQDISADVLQQLLPGLGTQLAIAGPATLNASAYDLMLLANHYFQQIKDAPVIDLGMLVRVIGFYEQATVADPDSAIAFSRLGEALLTLGDVEGAEKAIFKAMAIDSELSEVQNTLGLYYWTRFQPGSGAAHLKATELNPNNADAQEKYGKWLWHQQITDDVEPYFLRALELDPMSLLRYLDLGHFYGISNRRDEARDIAERIKSRFSGADAYMALGRIYELTGDIDEGIYWALQARELAPDEPLKSWFVAELYARIGDFEGAHHFEDPMGSFNVLYWERRYEEMIELGEELVFDQPNQIQLWYGLARAYNATGQYDQAIYVLQSNGLPEQALVDARRANGVEAMVTFADALNETGQTDRAHEYAAWLAESLARLSDTGAGDSWWPNFYEACSLSILGRDDEALAALERVNNSVGLLWYPHLVDAPCFRKFESEPRYRAVVTAYEDRLGDLRDRLPDTLARLQGTN